MKTKSNREFTVSWRALAKAHQRGASRPSILGKALGDGFLYDSNPIYRAVRDETLRLGYRFTTRDSIGYFGFSVVALLQIYRLKQIPYLDNASNFIQLSSGELGKIQIFRFPLPSANHHFHESAHCIGAEHLNIHKPVIRRKSLLVATLLNESMANALECALSIFVDSSADEFFYRLNSFLTPPEWVRKAVKESVQQIGIRLTLKLVCLNYLMSNFLYQSIRQQEMARIFKFLGLNRRQATVLMPIEKILAAQAFSLSKEFRLMTASTFLKLMGLRQPVDQLLAFDPLSFLEGDAELWPAMDRMIERLCSNISTIGTAARDGKKSVPKRGIAVQPS